MEFFSHGAKFPEKSSCLNRSELLAGRRRSLCLQTLSTADSDPPVLVLQGPNPDLSKLELVKLKVVQWSLTITRFTFRGLAVLRIFCV